MCGAEQNPSLTQCHVPRACEPTFVFLQEEDLQTQPLPEMRSSSACGQSCGGPSPYPRACPHHRREEDVRYQDVRKMCNVYVDVSDVCMLNRNLSNVSRLLEFDMETCANISLIPVTFSRNFSRVRNAHESQHRRRAVPLHLSESFFHTVRSINNVIAMPGSDLAILRV